MKLILIRHGETYWNAQGRCQGFSDIELSDRGKEQVELLALSLRDEPLDAVYSSDLKRAVETAELIAEHHGLSVEIDKNLREMNQGELEGLTFVYIRERYTELLGDWITSPEKVRIPGGESLKEVQERAWGSIQDIYKSHLDETVVIVSHNLTIITLLCKFMGIGLSEFRRFKIHASSKSIVAFADGRFDIKLLNNTAHLSPDLISGA